MCKFPQQRPSGQRYGDSSLCCLPQDTQQFQHLHQMAAWESSLQEERIPQKHTRACPLGSGALLVWNTLLQFSISSYSQAASLPSARHAPSLTEISLGCFCSGLWEGLVFVLPASRWHHAAALIGGCGNWRMLGRQGVGMTAPCLWVAPAFLSLKRYTKCRL